MAGVAVFWTPERVNALRGMAKRNMTAREISKEFGTTRNAILGVCYRKGISIGASTPEAKSVFAKKLWAKRREDGVTARRKDGRPRHTKESLLAAGIDQRILKMREAKMTWGQIGETLGVSMPTARIWAMLLGVHSPKNLRYTTPEQYEYIIKAWNEYVHWKVIAENIGRSEGVTRQIIMRLQHRGVLPGRDPMRSIAVQRYGYAYDDPRTGREMLNEAYAKQRAKVEADINAHRKAKVDKLLAVINQLEIDIKGGMGREQAIVKAREAGATLEALGQCFGITRERIRQICVKHGEKHGRSSNDGLDPAEGGEGA